MPEKNQSLEDKLAAEKYQIIEEVGRGGMGTVYRGMQMSLEREVAIKMLNEQATSDEQIIRRFKQEAKVIGRLNHQRIVTIYDVLELENRHIMVMEFIRGGTLEDLRQKYGMMAIHEACRICAQVCEGLQAAHDEGIIHRDIKPENIMILPSLEVKVMDFGIARLASGDGVKTQTGRSLGTPRYMSPEQIMAKNVDARTDLYSLGVVLYTLCCGRPPFEDKSPIIVAKMHLQDMADPPDHHNPKIERDLTGLLYKAMSKDPKDRYQSATEFRAVLEQMSERYRTMYEEVSESPTVLEKLVDDKNAPKIVAQDPAETPTPKDDSPGVSTGDLPTDAVAAAAAMSGKPVDNQPATVTDQIAANAPQIELVTKSGMKSLEEVAVGSGPVVQADKIYEDQLRGWLDSFLERAQIGRLTHWEAGLIGFIAPGIYTVLISPDIQKRRVGWAIFGTSIALSFMPLALAAQWIYRSYWALHTVLLNQDDPPFITFQKWFTRKYEIIVGVVGIFMFGLIALSWIGATHWRGVIQQKTNQKAIEYYKQLANRNQQAPPPAATTTDANQAGAVAMADSTPQLARTEQNNTTEPDRLAALADPPTPTPRPRDAGRPSDRIAGELTRTPEPTATPRPTPERVEQIPKPITTPPQQVDRTPLPRRTTIPVTTTPTPPPTPEPIPERTPQPTPEPTPDINMEDVTREGIEKVQAMALEPLPAVPESLRNLPNSENPPVEEDHLPTSLSEDPETLAEQVLLFRNERAYDDFRLLDALETLEEIAPDAEATDIVLTYLSVDLFEANIGTYKRLVEDELIPEWERALRQLQERRVLRNDKVFIQAAGRGASINATVNITEKVRVNIGQDEEENIISLLTDENETVRMNGVVIATKTDNSKLGPFLVDTLRLKDSRYYDNVFRWLADYGLANCIEPLVQLQDIGLGDPAYRRARSKIKFTITACKKNELRRRK
jgi:serine/threonine protein kinase